MTSRVPLPPSLSTDACTGLPVYWYYPTRTTPSMTHKHSDYMHWAKTQSRARYNLATSGVGAFPLRELPGAVPLEINGDNSYGYAPLKEAIAEYHDVDPDCVVTAAGTSMANYLAFAT